MCSLCLKWFYTWSTLDLPSYKYVPIFYCHILLKLLREIFFFFFPYYSSFYFLAILMKWLKIKLCSLNFIFKFLLGEAYFNF